MDAQQALLVVVFAVLTLVFVWLSLIFAGQEAAVTRVTRTSLNNQSLETQTDESLTRFEQPK